MAEHLLLQPQANQFPRPLRALRGRIFDKVTILFDYIQNSVIPFAVLNPSSFTPAHFTLFCSFLQSKDRETAGKNRRLKVFLLYIIGKFTLLLLHSAYC